MQRCEGEILVLEGLLPFNQTVGSLLRTPRPEKPSGKIQQEVISVNSLQLKNAINQFQSNAFGKVKNLTNLPTTISVMILKARHLLFLSNNGEQCRHLENNFLPNRMRLQKTDRENARVNAAFHAGVWEQKKLEIMTITQPLFLF